MPYFLSLLQKANANKLNSTVYFFFGVFLGLTALVFFGDLVAFFAGLALVYLLQPVSWPLVSPLSKIQRNGW
jgi:VIT1/CCC1 family predicted Fe2+/Mn2+ transporter